MEAETQLAGGVAKTADAPLEKYRKGRFTPGNGGGRPKGVVNKAPYAIKQMVEKALIGAGGVQYLIDCAHNPRTAAAFLGLVGKTLPLQVQGNLDSTVTQVVEVRVVGMQPAPLVERVDRE